MSTFQVQPPDKFEFGKPEEWLRWSRRFEQYRQASGLEGHPGEKQVSTLIYAMGDKAEDILRSLKLSEEDQKQYQPVKDGFDRHFIKRRNVIYERAKFNMRRQEEGETVDEFITSLYRLSEYCSYGELSDE